MKSVWQPHATFGGVIDISHNNGPVKWSLVPATIVLVMIKATQGSGFVDPRYVENDEGARDTGRLVIPYHFLDNSSIAAQLDNFHKITALPAGLPAMIDWEVEPQSNIRAPIATMEAFGNLLAEVIGRAPLAYHGMYDLTSAKINAWPWMIPKYGPQPKGPKFLFWQNTDKFPVLGIAQPIDHSIFSGTEAELRTWHKDGTMPAGFS